MSNNVIEQAIRPEVPDVIPNEFFYVYVPKATTTNPGIASFDADDFNVANGKVTINTEKWCDKTYVDGKLVASANHIVRGSTNYLVAVDTTLKTVNITSTDSETLEDGTIRSIPTTYNIPFKAGQGTTFVLNDDIIAIKSDVGRLGSISTAEIFNDYAGNVATGDYSHAEGKGTVASGQEQHVFGKYNVSDASNIEIVGGGTDNDNRKNIRTLSSSGDQWIAGKHSQEGTPTNDKDLTTKLYVDTIASSLNDDITSLQAIVGTGENYIGQLSGDSLPSSSDLDDYVQEQEGRAPKGGDTIMFVLYVTGGEDEIYKYMYNGTTWASFMIPAVEVSSNGELGVVKGTYGIGSSNDILVDIVNGEIKNIYAKDKDSNYVKMGLPASITETVTSVAAGTTGYDITCEVTEERVDNTSFSYDQVRNLPIVGGTGISLSVNNNLVKIDAEVTKSYVDSQDTTINNRITDSNIRINNLERSVYGELADWSDETFLSLKNAILPSTITVDDSTYNVIDGANGILSSVKGNTKQFNQLVRNGNFESTSGWTNSNKISFSVSNNICTITYLDSGSGYSYAIYRATGYRPPHIIGHKYLVTCKIRPSETNNYSYDFDNRVLGVTECQANVWTTVYAITTAENSIDNVYFARPSSTNVTIGATCEVKEAQLFDLTAMGLDSIATVAEFTALYPKAYYPYNAGTLYDSVISGVSFTGKNLWDEQWELGGINASTGRLENDNDRIRTKNYVKIVSGLTYAIYCSSRCAVTLCEYDENYTFIRTPLNGTNITNISKTFTASSNAKYVKFRTTSTYGTVYKNDIIFSQSSVITSYAPYALHTISLASTQTIGGVGTAQDEIQVTKNTNDDYYTVKKIQRFDTVTLNGTQPLQNVNWRPSETSVGWVYKRSVANTKVTPGNYVGNVISTILPAISYNSAYSMTADEGIALYQDTQFSFAVRSRNTSLTTENAINSYLSQNPITVTYELATPVETTLTETATLAEVSAIRENGGMISVVGNTNEDYAQPDVSETILHSVTPNA